MLPICLECIRATKYKESSMSTLIVHFQLWKNQPKQTLIGMPNSFNPAYFGRDIQMHTSILRT